jgi:delta-lactam-biosynthetic de-N-acetylase
MIALTFDAGGPADPTERILTILAKHHNHSTWFITGDWAKQNPDLVRRVWNDGHEIGNHTMHHPDLTTLSDEQICNEFNQADEVISAITGQSTRPYYRPPYGARTTHVRELAAQLGYRTIYWTIDTLDWQSDATPQKIIDRIMGNVSNGAIILMHAGSNAEADALDTVMTRLEEKGYQLVTLSLLLK